MTLESIFLFLLSNLSYLLLDGKGQSQRFECMTVSLEEFTVELHPLQTKCMQETLHSIHAHNHTNRNVKEEIHADCNNDCV